MWELFLGLGRRAESVSYEHFQTVMTADMFSPDGQTIIYGRPGEGRPRWTRDGRGWVSAYPLRA